MIIGNFHSTGKLTQLLQGLQTSGENSKELFLPKFLKISLKMFKHQWLSRAEKLGFKHSCVKRSSLVAIKGHYVPALILGSATSVIL